ncbi:hypothetical protein Trydic_g17395 [Trypoxylus dichotomus]
MAKTRPELIFVTFISSGIALILSVVALGTDQWVQADVNMTMSAVNRITNRVNYGLFTGSYTRRVSTESEFQLITNELHNNIMPSPKHLCSKVTCDFGENKCAMLCGNGDIRSEYLQFLLSGSTSMDGYIRCSTRSLRTRSNLHTVADTLLATSRADEDDPVRFINCGLWLSAIIFLCLSIIFGLAGTVLSVVNTVANPVETIFSTTGLFAYNCVACVCVVTVIVLFGVQFGLALTDNVAIFDTISDVANSDGQATIGYSFWLLLVPVIGYGTSTIVLAVRQYLINREPDPIVNLEDIKNDNTIILF